MKLRVFQICKLYIKVLLIWRLHIIPKERCRYQSLFESQSNLSQYPSFVHKILSPFWELCLMAHVCRPYSNIMELWTSIQTHICPSRTLFFVCLFDNMLVCPFVCYPLFVCPFVCYFLFVFPLCALLCLFAPLCAMFSLFSLCVLSLLLCLFFGLPVGFVFLLLLHVHAWSKGATSKKQARKGKNASKKMQAQKGQCLVDRRLSLHEWFSLSLF